MRVVMIGAGYVGLISGACFADFGHVVTCIDKDADKIHRLEDGVMPIYEPGLESLVALNVGEGRLSFATEMREAVEEADAVFIAVGTPSRRGDGHADLSYVHAAAEEIAPFLTGFTVVVTKSTVPAGTCDQIEALIRENRPDADVAVVSNPEFLREGAAINDFKRPDRVVVGLNDDRARAVMAELYRPLNLNETPMLFTERRTSELIKYAANSYLAMKITFINEMADLCEALDADVQHVARGIGLDNRIGAKFLHAGPGLGGSCLPKDTLALVRTAIDGGSPVSLVEAVVKANDARKAAMADKVHVVGVGLVGEAKHPDRLAGNVTAKGPDSRGAQSRDHPGAAGEGRAHPGFRSAGPRGAPAAALCRLQAGPVRGRRSGRLPAHSHRMGPVPRARSGPGEAVDARACRSRSAQHLPPSRDGGNWDPICERRAARRRARADVTASRPSPPDCGHRAL